MERQSTDKHKVGTRHSNRRASCYTGTKIELLMFRADSYITREAELLYLSDIIRAKKDENYITRIILIEAMMRDKK